MLQLESEKADLVWRLDGERLNVPIKLEYTEILFWLKSFTDGDANDEKHRERLIDTFINKIVLWNDKAYITYNVNGMDGEKVTVEQIIADFEKENEPNLKSSTRNSVVVATGLEPVTSCVSGKYSTN